MAEDLNGDNDKGGYKKGDKVFAKLKGFAVWPAVICRREPSKVETYKVYFYGTYDEGFVKVDFIFPYNEENIIKYGRAKKPKFAQAMAEIASNFEIKEAAELTPHVVTQQNINVSSEEEGELQIDEGLPPILQRQTELLPSTSYLNTPLAVTKRTPAKTAQRKGSKVKKNLLISVKNSTPSTPVPSNLIPSGGSGDEILTPVSTLQQEPEKLSRSGRKIKPKKFADDDEFELKVKKKEPRKNGGRGGTVIKVDDGFIEGTPPAAKRAKNGSTFKKGSTTMSQVDEQGVQTQDLIMGHHDFKNESILDKSTSQVIEFYLQNSKSKKATQKLDPKSAFNSSQSSSKVLVDNKIKNDYEKENLVEIEKVEAQVLSQFERQKENVKRMNIFVKKGEEIELTFDHEEKKRKEFSNVKEELDWDVATSQNILKIKNDLETQNPESFKMLEEIVNGHEPGGAAGSDPQDKSIYNEEIENDLKEKRQNTIRQLRVEGEMIEIIGEIVESLSSDLQEEGAADCEKAIELLERLSGHNLTTLMLTKHPLVLETIVKLRNYVGEPLEWGLTPEETEVLALNTKEIRRLSNEIFIKMAEIFQSKPDDDFIKYFYSQVAKFKEETKHLQVKTVLSLALDSSGKTIQLEIDSDDEDNNDNDEEEGVEMTGETEKNDENDLNRFVDNKFLLEQSDLDSIAMAMGVSQGQYQGQGQESDFCDTLYMDQVTDESTIAESKDVKYNINGIENNDDNQCKNESFSTTTTSTEEEEQVPP